MRILFKGLRKLAYLAAYITGFLSARNNRRNRLAQVLVDGSIRSKLIPNYGENMTIAMRRPKLCIGHGKLGES